MCTTLPSNLQDDKPSGTEQYGAPPRDKPWLALRGSGHFIGDPFAPVLSEEEIVILQNPDPEIDD
jgi:hypothetical protein